MREVRSPLLLLFLLLLIPASTSPILPPPRRARASPFCLSAARDDQECSPWATSAMASASSSAPGPTRQRRGGAETERRSRVASEERGPKTE
eukprot:8732563-Pyramimonas_sp.AAC.1